VKGFGSKEKRTLVSNSIRAFHSFNAIVSRAIREASFLPVPCRRQKISKTLFGGNEESTLRDYATQRTGKRNLVPLASERQNIAINLRYVIKINKTSDKTFMIIKRKGFALVISALRYSEGKEQILRRILRHVSRDIKRYYKTSHDFRLQNYRVQLGTTWMR